MASRPRRSIYCGAPPHRACRWGGQSRHLWAGIPRVRPSEQPQGLYRSYCACRKGMAGDRQRTDRSCSLLDSACRYKGKIMPDPDDITQLRARLAEARRTLAALLAQPALGDAAHAERIAAARAAIAEITAALRARGVVVDGGDEEAAPADAQRTVTTAGGAYAEGALHQQGVFVDGG